ncbi:hypothetical protein TWF481_011846 [Arthrobotrys musiformis]|uniref:G-protein coupled receptors family 1 profile domain-containing protein n=1 Tax=Arthrobotrys musiformis TaxID=47236 RepID=A0AAV9VWU5_9PEZI
MQPFGDTWSQRHLAGVVLAGSVLSIVGSLYMIFGFIFLRECRSFRHKLILGLAVSDLLLALNFFIPSLSMMTGMEVSSPSNGRFCSANGFLMQLFFAQIDVWQISIALITLLMLSGPSMVLKWIRENVWAVWTLPWVISLITAFFGFGFWDYEDVGGFCWLGSRNIRLYFNYIPRWVVIFVCLVIYIAVYRLILHARRRAKIQKTYRGRAADRAAPQPQPVPETTNESEKINPDEISSGNSSSSLDTSRAGSSTGFAPTVHDPAVAGQIQSAAEREQEEAEQQKQVRKIAIQMISYPLAYAVLWTVPTVVMIVQVVRGGEGVSIHVEGLAKMLLVFNGFVDAHVYGFNERTAMGWRQRIRPAGQEDGDEERAVDVVHEVVSRPEEALKNPNVWQRDNAV